MAAAVLVEATMVRLVPVPSIMGVLGGRDRWFPLLSSARLPLAGNVP
jgi:RND superfamily putative drug exporter